MKGQKVISEPCKWVVSGRHVTTLGKREVYEARIIEAETPDEAAVSFARSSSIAACRAGIDITVRAVRPQESEYRAQYSDPDAPSDVRLGDYGDLVVICEAHREVYRA